MAVQRVPVDEHDRLARALVLVVQLDRGAVLVPDGDESHGVAPLVVVGGRGGLIDSGGAQRLAEGLRALEALLAVLGERLRDDGVEGGDARAGMR